MAHLLMVEGWVSESGNLILPLLKQLGHTYMFVTRNPDHYKIAGQADQHPLFKNAVEVIEADTNDIPALIHRVQSLQFDGVITVCDYYFEAVRAIANAFKLPCPIPNNLKNIRQKHLMRSALDLAGVPNAKYSLAKTWSEALHKAEQIGYPLIVKPVDLGSSAFVRLVRNEGELRDAFDALDHFPLNFRGQERNRIVLLEELLCGEEVSVECVAFQGKISVIGVTDKSLTGTPYFIETGHMFPAALDEESYTEVTEYVKRALGAVGFENGIAHTEVKLTTSGPRIVEINPRTPGNFIVELIDRVTGINLLKVFLELALGKEPDLQRKETGIASAAVMFLVPSHVGTILEMQGLDTLKNNQHLARYHVPDCTGRSIEPPVDNACYLGHVIAEDRDGQRAREYAEQAINLIKLVFDD